MPALPPGFVSRGLTGAVSGRRCDEGNRVRLARIIEGSANDRLLGKSAGDLTGRPDPATQTVPPGVETTDAVAFTTHTARNVPGTFVLSAMR